MLPMCAARAPAHDDRGHHHAHFPHHRDADEIRDVEARTESGELYIPHECEDHADEETDQGDDG
jgi:hypothetical protein